MNSVPNSFPNFNAGFFWTVAAVAMLGVGMLLVFLMGRRVIHSFRIRRYDELAFKIHNQWREIVRGGVPMETWRKDPMQCEIVQSIVIQEIGAATGKDRAGLQEFLRASGLIDLCIEKVKEGHGWSRRRAILALGAMRVPEAIAPLSEVLDDWQLETRVAAVQALGRTGLAEAAEPIIEAFMVGGLKVPLDPVTNALLRCYLDRPAAILPFLRRSQGESRELLARVASELATAEMADDRLIRMKAASTLARFEHRRIEILQNIVDSSDRYALHAMISALELGGGFEQTLKELSDPLLHDETVERLVAALREGAAGLWAVRPADPVVESVFP